MTDYKGSSEYENLGLLGEGGQGTVFRVKRKKDGELLAMKQIDMRKMSQSRKETVENEFNIHCSLKHQYIVKAESFEYDDKVEKNFMFIYMEICSGGDLHEFIHKRAPLKEYLPEAEIWRLFAQLVDALDYLHNLSAESKTVRDILHRDLKPANIFLTDGHLEIRLGDFGLAIRIARNGSVTGDSGTPEYMAPQVINRLRYNQAADCYSLGVILYELCSLKFLFDDEDDESLKAKINAGTNAEIPLIYSSELRNVVKALVSIEPSKRPTTAMLKRKTGVQWGLTQIKLEESRKCHESIIQRFKIHKQNARVKDKQQNARIQTLQEQLARMKQEFQAQKNALDAKERELDEREANLQNRLEGIAKAEKRLSEQERQCQQDRAAFAKVPAQLPTSEPQAAIEDKRETQRAPNATKIAVSPKVPASNGCALELSTTKLGHQCSFGNSVRRQAKTVNLRKRFAPDARVDPSAALVLRQTSQRQPLSDGDMRPNASPSTHKSKIPVSTARKLSATQVAQPKENAGSTVGSNNQDIVEQPKGVKHTAAARKAKAPLHPTRAPYNTRSAVRNVNQALALRGL